MKKASTIIAIICIIIGSFMYTFHVASKEVMSKGLLEVALKDVSLSSLVGDIYVSKGIQSQFEEVKQEIIEDPALQEMIEKYSENILAAVTTGKGIMPNIDSDIKVLLNEHSEELMNILPISLTKEQEEELIDIVFKNVDFQPIYDRSVAFANNQLPDSVKPLLYGLTWLNGNIGFITAMLLIIVGVVILVIKHQKDKKWLLYGSIAFLSSMLLLFISSFMLSTMTSYFMDFTKTIQDIATILLSCTTDSMQSNALFIGSIGAFLYLLYYLFTKVMTRKRQTATRNQ